MVIYQLIHKVFEKMIGVHGADEIERCIDTGVLEQFRGALGQLWEMRNKCAHQTLENTMGSQQAPSMTISQFAKIRRGFEEFEKAIDSLERVVIRL